MAPNAAPSLDAPPPLLEPAAAAERTLEPRDPQEPPPPLVGEGRDEGAERHPPERHALSLRQSDSAPTGSYPDRAPTPSAGRLPQDEGESGAADRNGRPNDPVETRKDPESILPRERPSAPVAVHHQVTHREPPSSAPPLPPAPGIERSAAQQPPRIHIGVVEVRTTPPASPVPPAPAARTVIVAPPPRGPLARPFGWRYGLGQS
jgi:hypothetical protein